MTTEYVYSSTGFTHIGDNSPDGELYETWLDTSSNPAVWKVYHSGTWKDFCQISVISGPLSITTETRRKRSLWAFIQEDVPERDMELGDLWLRPSSGTVYIFVSDNWSNLGTVP